MVGGRQHAYHKRLHEKYGPVVRVSPNELIFCGPDAWTDIYGNQPGKADMEKSPLVAGGLPVNIPARALTVAPWHDHVRQRRAFAYPFSNTALLGQEPLIQQHIDTFISSLDTFAVQGNPVNLAAWLTYATFDIIGTLCFAEPFGCLENGAATEWSTSIAQIGNAGIYEQAMRRVAGVNTPLQKLLARFLTPKKYQEWRKVHFANSREKTLRRLADEDRDHKDFLYYVLKNNEAKSTLSELEIIMNTALFVAAGSDTTALVLTSWANLMLRNREAYHRLVKEVRGAFRSPSDISFHTVKDLPYLGAVINETFRVCAPVPTNLPRSVPPGGANIDGNWVPGGTTVSVSAWAATHLPTNWDYPLEFIPERWLASDEQRFPGDKRQASQPFSYGPRGCIGKNLSYIEQRLIICHLLLAFDIEEPVREAERRENEQWTLEGDMEHMRAYLVWEKPALWVQLRRRERGD